MKAKGRREFSNSSGESAAAKLCPKRGFIMILLAIFILQSGYAQVTPFEKSVLDSLESNDFNMSVAFVFNAAQDGTNTLTTGNDASVMYSTEKSNYQLVQSSYHNRLDQLSTSNRFFAMAIASLFSHQEDSSGQKLVEKQFYPEPFVLYQYDANRGLNYRWQFGLDAVYAFVPTRHFRIKMGAGLLYEMENWQMIKKENLQYVDTLPEPIQRYIFDTVGINSKGELFRNNVRMNLYANMMCNFGRGINLNAFFNVQEPFVPPFHGLPSNDLPQAKIFPVNTKRYPRLTLDMTLTFKLFGKLSFVSSFNLQYDKGQIPLYAPDFIYNLTQGIQFDW